jgi:hypothetical protein
MEPTITFVTTSENREHKFPSVRLFKNRVGNVILVFLAYWVLFLTFFSPAFFGNYLLAPGDGVVYQLPNFFGEKALWDPLLASGYPLLSDPQVMSWYPPAMIFGHIPGGWNLFVVSAYVLASCFAYGYVYTITGSRLAGFASGLIYGLSGFMMAHLGHTNIIHCAAWLPLIIWSLEKLRHSLNLGWFVAGGVAVAMSFLAGHTQIFVNSLAVAALYVIFFGWNAPISRWRYYPLTLLLVLLGVGLAAIQIFPTAVLAAQSPRMEFAFAEFVSYSYPPSQLPMLIFPAIYGFSNIGVTRYSLQGNSTELAGYIGLLPLMLGAIGFIASRRQKIALFWLSIAVLMFLLTLGGATPLARIIALVPVLKWFRAPARHLLEFGFAVSVLAGIGVAAILRRRVSRRLLLTTGSIVGALMVICLLLLAFGYLNAAAAQQGLGRSNLLPWNNRAVGVPLMVFLAGAPALIFWHQKPHSIPRGMLFLSVLALDLASFGWFYEWRFVSPDKSDLSPPEIAVKYRDILSATNQRLLPVRGTSAGRDEIGPNVSRIWGVPSAGVFSPLILSRYSQLMSMSDLGAVGTAWKNQQDQSLNIMAVRYVLMPENQPREDLHGVSWLGEDMNTWLGQACGQPSQGSVKFNLPQPIRADALGIVGRLACATAITDGQEVVRVNLIDADGNSVSQSLVAGRDMSEWAYDCPGVKDAVNHKRAMIFRSYSARMNENPCEGHQYWSTLRFNGARNIKSLEFQWIAGSGVMILDKVSLINQEAKVSEPISDLLSESNRWRLAEVRGHVRVLENSQAMPRVWLTSEVLTVAPEEALTIVKTSLMPDGRHFEPSRVALLEEPLTMSAQRQEGESSARLINLSHTTMEVETSSATSSFLVTSDVYYPGWQSTVDGAQSHLFKTNYVLRGVALPPGHHVVKFEFQPQPFYYGAVMSVFSIIASLALLFVSYIQARRLKLAENKNRV